MPSSSGLKTSWRRFRDTRDPAALRLLLVLAGAASLLALYLAAGPSPWENAIVKRLAAGRELKLEHFISIGLWWGAAAGLGASLAALATAKWWSRPLSPVYPERSLPSPKTTRWTLIFAVAAMALAAWPRAARLSHSLWNDEEYHLRTYVLGAWKPEAGPAASKPPEAGAEPSETAAAAPAITPEKSDALKLDAVTWQEAVFKNEKGNNHLWSSIEVRLGHLLGGQGWKPDTTFSEPSLRLFPFLSGILTVGFTVLLGAALGGPRLGLAAGLILALHPWHVRWSVEIRGYSTMLLAITAGLWFLLQALQSNRWRWWLGFAGCQTLFLLCFAGSVYVAAAQNLVALAVILRSPAPGSVRLGTASRLFTAGIVSFIPAALLFGPHVPQIAAYLKSAHDYAPVNTAWFADLWTHLVTGLRPAADAPGTSLGLGLPDLISAAPWKKWAVYGLIPLLCLGGLLMLLRQDWRTRLVTGTLLLAGALAIGHNAASGTAFLTWYVLYLLPLFVLSLVQGAAGLAGLRPASLSSLPLMAAVLFSLVTSPALARIMKIPRQPIRETVEAMRGVSPALQNPGNPRLLTASFGDGARQMLSYDPRLRILKTPEDLARLTREAQAAGRPLRLCLRGPEAMARENPALLETVTSDPRWMPLPPVQGMEAMLSYAVYEFSPDTVPRVRLQPPPPPLKLPQPQPAASLPPAPSPQTSASAPAAPAPGSSAAPVPPIPDPAPAAVPAAPGSLPAPGASDARQAPARTPADPPDQAPAPPPASNPAPPAGSPSSPAGSPSSPA